jgi:hypothetical protein
VIEDTKIAGRYLNQWAKLVEAGDDMPADLKAANSQPTVDTTSPCTSPRRTVTSNSNAFFS